MVKPKILLIDNNKDLCESIKDILELDSYTVGVSHTAEDGLNKVVHGGFYNIVLLDKMLPDSDGIIVLERVKEISPNTEVIIITAYADMDSVIKAMDRGAFSFLPKPFEIPYLVTTIKRAREKQKISFENRILYEQTVTEEREWEDTFDAISDLISIHDKDFIIIRCNKAVVNKLNVKYGDIIGKKCHEVFQGRNEPWSKCPFVRCKETLRVETEEQECMGGVFLMSCNPRFDEAGNFNGVIRIARDITEQKISENKLKESEGQFRSTFDQSGVGIAHIALNGHFLRVNRILCEVLGYSEDEIVGLLTFQNIIHSKELETDIEFDTLLIAGKINTHSVEKRFIRKDGTIIWVNITVSLVRESDGEPKYFISVFDDITKRKLAEEELKQIEWLMTKEAATKPVYKEFPTYGDLTKLDTSHLILGSVGKDLLQNIVNYYIDLLGTSVAVYERDGTYALGLFTSGWCQFLDESPRSRCRSVYNAVVLKSGKFLCHESFWNDASKKAINSGLPTEIKCHGDIYIYAVPIKAGGQIVGAVNFGHGNPPKDREKLKEIADLYDIDLNTLWKQANAYKSRPPAIISIAKRHLIDSAMLIGEIVERRQVEKSLRQSEEKFRAIFDNTFQFISLLRPDGTLMEVNRGPLDFADIKRSDVINKPVWKAPWWAHSENLQNIMKKSIREAAKGNFIRFETTECGHDGILANIDISLTPVKDNDGNTIYIIKEGRDITELKKTEERLHILSLAVEQSPVSIVITDKVGNIEYINQKFCALSGCSRSELIGHNMRMLKSDEKTDEEYRELWNTLKSGRAWTGEFLNKKKNGELYWEHAHISPIWNNDGVITHFLSVNEDITNRKKSDEALLESEEKFRIISTAAPDAIIMTDSNNVISYWNMAAQKIFGFTAKEAVGKKLHETIIPVQDHQRFLNGYEELKKFGKKDSIGKSSEMTAKNKDGEEFLIDISITVVKLRNEWQSIAILRDISERVLIEEKLRESYKMASLGQLTAGVFHEILNPVNIISSHVQLLLMEAEEESKTEKDLKSIQEEIKRIVKITDGLLRFSRTGDFCTDNIVINDLLEKTISIIEPDMKLDNVKFIRKFDDRLPLMLVNSDELRQVFLNLITNARDAMPEGGTITVSTENIKEGKVSFVRIKTTDTGCGIDQDKTKMIFDPFFTTKKEGKGTGLGLSTSYGIIEGHGGIIRAESQVGKGTTFVIDLPVKT